MKTHRFFSVFLLLILAVSLLTGPASAAEVPDPAIQAKAALLVDANTGRMVYGKNEHEELYPASLTKIMTALLTLEAVDSGQLSMDQPITVTESALEGLAADGSTAAEAEGPLANLVHIGGDAPCHAAQEHRSDFDPTFDTPQNPRNCPHCGQL